MSTKVSNLWIAENREKIFANTSAFNAETPMAGREESVQVLETIIMSGGERKCVILSDLLGAGKTFFLQHGFANIANNGGLDEENDVNTYLIDEIDDELSIDDVLGRVLVVDDLDRKAGFPAIKAAVTFVNEWLRSDRTAILIGDYSLRNAKLLSELKTNWGIEQIELEPLDQNLIHQAVRMRLYHWLRQPPFNLNENDAKTEVEEAEQGMFDQELLNSLLPSTEPPIATFREVLNILQNLAGFLPLDGEPCFFTADTYQRWLRSSGVQMQRDKRRAYFVDALYRIIAQSQYAVWKPRDVGGWLELLEVPRSHHQDYEKEVIEPLVRAEVLLPMGVPYSEPEVKRLPGPYLPTIQSFTTAMLGKQFQ